MQDLCPYCQAKIDKENSKKHIELCQEASKFMDEQKCLICDVEFESTIKVTKHIKKEHLDIIIVKEIPSEISSQSIPTVKIEDIKQEVIEPIKTPAQIKKEKNIEGFKTPAQIKKERFNNDVEIEEIQPVMNNSQYLEPPELTTIFTCPLCFKKYGSLKNVETHISLFHRISRKVQRQAMQEGRSMKIIQEPLSS